jgi:hypothetical protein
MQSKTKNKTKNRADKHLKLLLPKGKLIKKRKKRKKEKKRKEVIVEALIRYR